MSANQVVSIAVKDAVERRVNELRRRDDNVKARVAPILKRLWDPRRKLLSGADAGVFDDLQQRFPNFSPVIHYWRSVALASQKLNAPFLPQPILLGGLPGLGKTIFAAESAKAMGMYFAEISMATMTASFVISGGSLQWGDGSPGFIAKSLADSPVGNPLLLIDEVDKASGEARYSPLGPFYPLLERHSASRFRDEALELEIDASNVVWVATANDASQIPDPILSRMKYFEIRAPEPEEMVAIIHNMYRIIRATEAFGELLDEIIPESTVRMFTAMLPREARRHLNEACINAFISGRGTVLTSDVPVNTKRVTRFGFI